MQIPLSTIFNNIIDAQKSNLPQSTATETFCLKLLISTLVQDKHFIIAPDYRTDSDNTILITKFINDHGKEENVSINVDLPLTIRARNNYLGENLCELSEDDLFKAITLNIFEQQPFISGNYKDIFRSLGQSHYDPEKNIFDYSPKNTKILGLNKVATPGVNFIITPQKQDDASKIIAKRPSNRGVYFLYNNDKFASGMISPHFEGDNLYGYFIDAKNAIEAGDNTLEDFKFQFKVIIINLFKELAILHHKNLIHRDIKMENIMVVEIHDEQHNTIGVEIRLIDIDLIVSNNEKVTGIRGTPIVIPLQSHYTFWQSGTSTPYQDIYGALICGATLLHPIVDIGSSVIGEKLLEAYNNGNEELLLSYCNTMRDYFITSLTDANDSFVTNNIIPGFQDPTITSFQILVNMINTDNSLAKYVIGKLVTTEENKNSIKQYYERKPFTLTNCSTYLAECFMGIENFSADELKKRLNPVKANSSERKVESIETTLSLKRKIQGMQNSESSAKIQKASFFWRDDLFLLSKKEIQLHRSVSHTI